MNSGVAVLDRMSSRLARCVVALGLAAGLMMPATAHARSSVTLPYAASDVWAAAVRFLRVDRNLPVREKDEAAGYVLFDVAESGKTYRASLELVALTDDAGRVSTQATLSIPQLPRRYEGTLLDQLAAKVRDERGPPPPPRRPPQPRAEAPEKEKAGDAPKPHLVPDGGLPRATTLPSP